MTELDELGSFYLGRRHDLAAGQTLAKPLLYDSNDLTTHAICVGMTGSGKTGLCLSLLEEAALDGIPAIAIDPKGDLGNLLLAFPSLEAGDFRPWVDPSEAARRQMSPDDYAASQAELWRRGLEKWGQGSDRIRRFCEAAERVIYTPGSTAGIPITVLKSFRAPPADLVADGDAFQERIASATSGLLALLGIDADPLRSREHIFLSNVLEASWRAGRDLDLVQLIRKIHEPPLNKIGVVDLESFFPGAERTKLAMRMNNLLASPSFAAWMEGEPLDIGRLLYTPEGKPRLAVVSIAHLDEAQRMFFVTILLNEILAWVRSQPGTSSLRAILYMDEIFGYFPPLANPPSKRPMLTLLKQARAYGLGCVLATQNPVDLDYKGLSNTGTWFLGRLQTERDKARVIEGLEGASAQAGSTFNRRQMEATLAALGSRVFLMNNVHEDAPVVFHTRWAMSYLRGPLTREQIKQLMDPVRSWFVRPDAGAPESAQEGAPRESGPQATQHHLANSRPILPPSIHETFVAVQQRVPDGFRLEYRPALLGKGKVHFVRAADGVDLWRGCTLLQSFHEQPADDVWAGAPSLPQGIAIAEQPDEHGEFAELPGELARVKSYPIFERHLKDHLYRTESLELWQCKDVGHVSRPEESQAEFRTRLTPILQTEHAAARQRLESQSEVKLADIDATIARHEARLSTQRWQFFARLGGILWVVFEGGLRAMGAGRRGRPRSAEVAFRQAATERGRQANAQIELDKARGARQRLEQELESRRSELDAKFSPQTIAIEPLELKPQKSDIEIDGATLAWLPWRVDGAGSAEPVY